MVKPGRLLTLVSLLVLVVVIGLYIIPPAQATHGTPTTSTLIGIRAARHDEATPRYDRVVFDFAGPVPHMDIGYVGVLIQDGSGLPIKVAGNAILQLRFTATYAHTESGRPTAPRYVAYKLPIVKEVVRAGDFEGVVTYGIGVIRKAHIDIITLGGHSRIVVDFLEE